MLEVEVETTIAVEAPQVWAVLTDHERLDRWMNLERAVRLRPGIREPNGIGAVRALYARGRIMEERITAFEVDRRLAYDVLRGAPGWATHGEFVLSPLGDGRTHVRWKVVSHPYVPPATALLRAFLKRSLARSLERLRQRLEPEPLFAYQARREELVAKPRPSPARGRAARESYPGASGQ